MDFKTKLNSYMQLIDCSSKELSDASELSTSVISRYRSGNRIPSSQSEQFEMLINGIIRIADSKSLQNITYKQIRKDFESILSPTYTLEEVSKKLNLLIISFNINVSSMAKAMNYDASFISRIRNGKRMISNIDPFINNLAIYIFKNYQEDILSANLFDEKTISDKSALDIATFSAILKKWFLDTNSKSTNQASSFLHKLDDFNLSDYINSIKFNNIKIPSIPFQMHTKKDLYGLEGQKKAELDFLKGTVLAKSKECICMCNDMDMSDMAQDLDFSKKWMFGLAMILRRGIQINMIHNLNRPFNELMLGLEAWIPLYMTGLVTPYYIKNANNSLYQHLLYVSGAFSLSGECIKGFHSNGKYHLTNHKAEVAYYKTQFNSLLKKSSSLMDIYTVDRFEDFKTFYNHSLTIGGTRHFISSSLPLFTLPEDKLISILKSNNISTTDINKLIVFTKNNKRSIEALLLNNAIIQDIPLITKEEFETHPLILDFMECNYDTVIKYSYQDYLLHIEYCKDFESSHVNYTLNQCSNFTYRNIQIKILEGKWVWISKTNSPSIHFIIRHPSLREAIENMYVPILEK